MSDVACCVADWGTTSFRLWAIDRSGAAVASHRAADGSFKLKAPQDFERVLNDGLRLVDAPADAPVLIAGMAGSAQGWREAPYVDAPTRLIAIADNAIAAPMPDRDVRILPGIAQRDPSRPDVMRGEETILLGLHCDHGIDGLFCQPGTHSKWIETSGDVVERFRTALTGEIFALLSEHSTLAPFAKGKGFHGFSSPEFADAVLEAANNPERLSGALFSVRAGGVLFGDMAGDGRARLSGLLIGAELAEMNPGGQEVSLLSTGGLRALYAKAFELVGISYSALDAEDAARSGLWAAAERIWPDRFSEARL